MVLLLGKNELVEEYANIVLKIDINGELKTRKLTKEKAKQVREDYNSELR